MWRLWRLVEWSLEKPENAIAALTGVLIIITGFYAVMAWRMARLMANDLQLRLRPFIRIRLDRVREEGNRREFTVGITAVRGAAIIKKAGVVFTLQGVPPRRITVNVDPQNSLIAEGTTEGFPETVECDRWPESWVATVIFSDAIGMHTYAQIATQGNIEYPFPDPITRWFRLTTWVQNRWKKIRR